MDKSAEQLSLPFEMPAAGAGTDESANKRIAISRDAINQLPIRSFNGRVVLVTGDDEVPPALEELSRETILGFDTETKPAFRAGVSYPPALLQFAGASTAWIFQLRKLRYLSPLFTVLANGRIIKAGIALADDLKKLKELHQFTPAGFVEIGDLARKLGYAQTGLRTLAAMTLGFRVSKREQRSNWARSELTPAQITYAATDAWVSRELYLKLSAELSARASGELLFPQSHPAANGA